MKKKADQLATVLKELAEMKASNAMMKASNATLTEEWNKAKETIRSLQATLNMPRSETSEVCSEEFRENIRASSTNRVSEQKETSAELSRFISSVNQMSISSITVPECKPLEGSETIGRQDFEAWQDLLVDSMKLAGITDEAYFMSGSDVLLQRRKLSMMEQKPEENDLSFIMRVGATARLCEFPTDKEFEQIASTVAEHAKHREVRIAALKLLGQDGLKGSFTDLVDEVRQIETIRLNEEYFNKKHGIQNQVIIARTTDDETRQGNPRRSAGLGRGRNNNYRQEAIRPRNITMWRGSNSSNPQRCFRCNRTDHKAKDCFAENMTCNNCGVKGHLWRACRSYVRGRNMQLQGNRAVEWNQSEISVKRKKHDRRVFWFLVLFVLRN